MPEHIENLVVTTVQEQLETVHTERKLVSLPSPANSIYETKVKYCRVRTQVHNKSVQLKCTVTTDTVYVERDSMTLKFFSWGWEIDTFIYLQKSVAGIYCKTKLLKDSIIHAVLSSPGELLFDTRLHFNISVLKDVVISRDQLALGTGEVKADDNRLNKDQEQILVTRGVRSIQFEVE